MKKIFLLFLLISNQCFSQVNLKFGLKAWYPFSGNAKDESGNNNHPVFNNASLTADRFGNPKSAYRFNGVSSYIKILNSPSLNTNNKLSISVWVKPQGFYKGKCHGNSILMKGDADYLTGNYFLRFEDGAYLKGTHCDSDSDADPLHQNFTAAQAASLSPYVKANRWYSLTATYDGKLAKLYVDCKLVASLPQKGATFTNLYDLYLGRANSSAFPYWFKGELDDLRIYNRTLNQQEIEAICNEIPEVKLPEVKKPEFVKAKPKEKKNKEIEKLKTVVVPSQSINESNPLTVTKDQVTLQPGIIKPLPFENEKEIVLEERKNDLIKEITVENDSVSVTLYDNGIIDGDSVTLIYNNKILTAHQLLTEKPLTFYIKIEQGNNRNELVMYAENLGSIPPNTAMMVIYDGNKRYELNVSSSKTSNGVVSFKLRK